MSRNRLKVCGLCSSLAAANFSPNICFPGKVSAEFILGNSAIKESTKLAVSGKFLMCDLGIYAKCREISGFTLFEVSVCSRYSLQCHAHIHIVLQAFLNISHQEWVSKNFFPAHISHRRTVGRKIFSSKQFLRNDIGLGSFVVLSHKTRLQTQCSN